MRAYCQYPFKNVNAFFDTVSIEIESTSCDCVCPHLEYPKRFHLLAQDAPLWAAKAVNGITWPTRGSMGYCVPDAASGPQDRTVVMCYHDANAFTTGFAETIISNYPGVKIERLNLYDNTPDPPTTPTPPSGEYNYDVVKTGSKLHTHAISEGGTYDLLEYLVSQGVALPYCKFLAVTPAQLQGVANLKALSPETKFVARLMRLDGYPDNFVEGPDFNGSPTAYMNALLPVMLAHQEVDYWELWNEQDPPGVSGQVTMASFACGCMDIADQHGIKLALMSYSTGVPEIEEWEGILNQTQFFQKAQAGGHILSLHAYGRTTDQGSLEYHLLRPLRLYEELLVPAGLVVPYIMTEYCINETAPGAGITDWSMPDLMKEIANFDQMLAQQYYCLGASLFTMGEGWQHYSFNSLWQDVAGLIVSARDRVNSVP